MYKHIYKYLHLHKHIYHNSYSHLIHMSKEYYSKKAILSFDFPPKNLQHTVHPRACSRKVMTSVNSLHQKETTENEASEGAGNFVSSELCKCTQHRYVYKILGIYPLGRAECALLCARLVVVYKASVIIQKCGCFWVLFPYHEGIRGF